MTDNARFERFVAKLAGAHGSAMPEGLEQADLDLVESPGSDDSLRIVDSREGASASARAFEAAFTRPEGYPADWPFLPNTAAVFTAVGSDQTEQAGVFWFAPADPNQALASIRAGMIEAGWHEHVIEAGTQDRIATHVVWHHRNSDWRILTRGVMIEGEESLLMRTSVRQRSHVEERSNEEL
jgi:hypothetical protein